MIRLLFLAAAMAAAQEPSAPTFRSGVELIQVSVIAQDKRGKPVTDLTREDFQLFDNGAPRQIRLFVADNSGPPPPESKTPGLFTNQLSHRGYSVILIDSLFTDFGDPEKGAGSSFARLQTLRMLRSIPAGDRVAIYALERSLRVICEFTTDRDLLVQRLGKWKPSVDTPGTSNDILQASTGMWDDRRGDAPEKAAAATVTAGSQVRESSLENAMILIADHLETIPGRKNLILLGRHFSIGPRPLQKFKDANVAVYPIDVNGPMLAPPSMLAMAQQTGGVAFYGRNDVNAAIREAMDDGRTSYTLGFYQSDDDRPAQIHALEVRVNRPGVTLRYRASYRTEPPHAPSAIQKTDLAQALDKPVESTAVSIQATATRASQDRLDIHAVVDVAGLDLALSGDRRTGRIDIVARFMGSDGKSAGPLVSQKLNLNLRKATYETVLKQGIAYHNVLKIPPKAVELRLLFANPTSSKIGTLIIPLSEAAGGGSK